jgi:hypothetical protein
MNVSMEHISEFNSFVKNFFGSFDIDQCAWASRKQSGSKLKGVIRFWIINSPPLVNVHRFCLLINHRLAGEIY